MRTPLRRLRNAGAIVAGAALLLSGCGSGEQRAGHQAGAAERSAVPSPAPQAAAPGQRSAPGSPPPGSRSGSPATPPPAATGSPTSSAESSSPGPRLLRHGDRGPAVRALQRQLTEMDYDPGPVDGRFGPVTQYAVWAFQKVNDLRADGIVGPKTRRALRGPATPRPLVPSGPGDRVEIDLDRQLLYLYADDGLRLISHISSGSGEYYCSQGRCRYATTPPGDFRAFRRVSGWDPSPLGRLYNPIYFNGGIAVHGFPSVPSYPASHGCVRIPMHIAEYFPDLVEKGERVYVRA